MILALVKMALASSLTFAFAETPAADAATVFRPGNFQPICGSVWIENGFDLKLTDMERRLLCGDDKQDPIGKSWSDIPANQAQYFMMTFLQARGRHRPEFKFADGRLYVRPGETTSLTRFEIFGGPSFWEPPHLRNVLGSTLTPAKMNELEAWTRRQVQNEGFACAEASALADPQTGLVRMQVDPKRRTRIVGVRDESETGLDANVLDRYNAFRIGDFYSDDLVQLTRQRILDASLLQAVAFSHSCNADTVVINRDALIGPPREARIGFGGNTETKLRVRALLRQNRLFSSASTAELQADFSFRAQRASALGRWYYSSTDPSDFIEPVLRFERLDEPQFLSRSITTAIFHAWVTEHARGRTEARLGPSWIFTRLYRGVGPRSSTVPTLEGNLSWISHNSELYQMSPREGTRLLGEVLHTERVWGSPFTATRVAMSGLVLGNLFRYDPPLAVLGIRFTMGTTMIEDRSDPTQLPVRFRFFSGGNDDMRGFERQSLPNNTIGALTEATLGAELRFYRALFKRLDPFLFVDVGRVGHEELQLDEPIYVSPGFGLRWESPVGTFRGYFARGEVINQPVAVDVQERWRAGISFGEEF